MHLNVADGALLLEQMEVLLIVANDIMA